MNTVSGVARSFNEIYDMNDVCNRVIHGDCIEHLKKIPNETVDVIFADPPYNLQLRKNLYRPDCTKVKGVREEWDQFTDFKAYDAFTESWLVECQRILKKTGTIWIIGSYHNIFRVGAIAQNLGLWILNDIVWLKTNPMPNFRGTRFTNAHETMIWCGKSQKSSSHFHYETLKNLNEDRQMRSDWEFPICAGVERLKTEEGKTLHPTQKPEALLHRVIMASTVPGDLVLDPFSGSGTTLSVAKKLGRHFIGIESDAEYVHASQNRLNAIAGPKPDDPLFQPFKKPRPKPIPFGQLIEQGILSVGQELRHVKKDFSAKIRSDSLLCCDRNGDIGSIHQLGAKLIGSSTCNGWLFWSYLDTKDNQWKLIDQLRDRV